MRGLGRYLTADYRPFWRGFYRSVFLAYAIGSTVATAYLIHRLHKFASAEAYVYTCEARLELLECVLSIRNGVECDDWREFR